MSVALGFIVGIPVALVLIYVWERFTFERSQVQVTANDSDDCGDTDLCIEIQSNPVDGLGSVDADGSGLGSDPVNERGFVPGFVTAPAPVVQESTRYTQTPKAVDALTIFTGANARKLTFGERVDARGNYVGMSTNTLLIQRLDTAREALNGPKAVDGMSPVLTSIVRAELFATKRELMKRGVLVSALVVAGFAGSILGFERVDAASGCAGFANQAIESGMNPDNVVFYVHERGCRAWVTADGSVDGLTPDRSTFCTRRAYRAGRLGLTGYALNVYVSHPNARNANARCVKYEDGTFAPE